MGKRYWLAIPGLIALLSGAAAAADPPVTQAQAMALLRDGKRPEALRAFDAIIASRQGDTSMALFMASRMDLEDGNWRAARPYTQELVKLHPDAFEVWELMIQVDQAAGSRRDRDEAILSLYGCWHTSPDPRIQSRASFVRDRVASAAHTLIAQQMLDPGGGDERVLFVFQPAEEARQPRHVIVVRSDTQTNQRWQEDAQVPYGTVVYHLDTVDQQAVGDAPGVGDAGVVGSSTRTYEFYVEAPDYDRVRAKVVEILAGTAQPMNGGADPFWAGGSGH